MMLPLIICFFKNSDFICSKFLGVVCLIVNSIMYQKSEGSGKTVNMHMKMTSSSNKDNSILQWVGLQCVTVVFPDQTHLLFEVLIW